MNDNRWTAKQRQKSDMEDYMMKRNNFKKLLDRIYEQPKQGVQAVSALVEKINPL